MTRILPATPGVLPGTAITRRKGAHRVHRSLRVLWGAALVAVLTVLALLPAAGHTSRTHTHPAQEQSGAFVGWGPERRRSAAPGVENVERNQRDALRWFEICHLTDARRSGAVA